MSSPLDGLRVLDLTRVLAGPWCTQMLADFGADVIKVENPDGGDDTRSWGPPFLKDKDGNDTREAAYYLSANRNKRSVTVNLRSEEGRQVIRDLAARSDVLVENFKVGGLTKMGLGYEDLKKINPRLIYVSITGFGQTGPRAQEPGYDYLIQGLGGIMSPATRTERPAPGRSASASPSPTSRRACIPPSPPSPRWRTARRPAAASTSTWPC